ncbi:DUF7467 domain-containing protein [Halorarius halobius]|uniref:DUF7467 domain-containing protein n=1 Tax=Halorarius halobius TaxID=2962671 RepID=UPI0020CFB4B2|nr:hypothetical protein [Halorarius halobius]
MTDLSRRRVLAALATAGGAGAFAGGGTAAMFGDRETLAATVQAGAVDLAIGYRVLSGPNADPGVERVVDGPAVRLPVSELSAGTDAGSVLLQVMLPAVPGGVNNPTVPWLRTLCPPASTLGELLFVRVSYADCETGARGGQLVSGSLREVADALRNGVPLDADPATAAFDCLTDELCLLVEYELDGYLGSDATDLSLELYGYQCRHTDPTVSPFAPTEPCPAGDPCPCCVYVGKVEFDDDIAVGTYPMTEGETAYALDVYAVDDPTDTSALAFRVRGPGGLRPTLCRVDVKGANPNATGLADDTATYEPAGAYSDDTASLESVDDEGAPVTGGLLTAPGGKGVSHVKLYVCAACDDGGDCVECGEGADDANRVGSLTFRYDGAATAGVRVEDRDRGQDIIVYDAVVAPGETFTVTPAAGDRFHPNIGLYVDHGRHATLHTSCSQPLYVGQPVGEFVIVAASDADGRPLCDGGDR